MKKNFKLEGLDCANCAAKMEKQINDLPMVTAFKGFAVSNAVPALKEAAPYSCNRICDMIDRILSGELDGE